MARSGVEEEERRPTVRPGRGAMGEGDGLAEEMHRPWEEGKGCGGGEEGAGVGGGGEGPARGGLWLPGRLRGMASWAPPPLFSRSGRW